MVTATFAPSKYQTDIFDWVSNASGDCVVQAAAGSGKTTTLVQASSLLSTDRSLFVAFNKHIVQELERKLPNMAVKTIHSLGMGCLHQIKKPRLVNTKYRKICKAHAIDICLAHQALDLIEWKIARDLEKLSSFCRLTLTESSDHAAIRKMIAHYGIDIDHSSLLIPSVGKVLEEGAMVFKYTGEIDFTDMLWLPAYFDLYPGRVDWLFIDEAQDLNQAQLSLVMKARGAGGRMLFCGDSNQAIMGFAGALSDSIDQIIAQTFASVFPLSICYRCPESHIKLAQSIVPSIESRPGAIEGIIDQVSAGNLHTSVREGDLILCRMTAPLISQCIKLIGERIPARVRGRDIGKQLTSIVEDVAEIPNFSFDKFGFYLSAYEEDKIARLKQREDSESAIEKLTDKCEGIRVCFEKFGCHTLENFCTEIEGLFSDDKPSVMLSTVHRAKGLESDRVSILKPEKLPLIWPNQKEHELEQEYNLKYVALTRSKNYLAFVE